MFPSPSRLAADSLRLLPRKRISRLLGRAADLRRPTTAIQQAIGAFSRAYGVELDDYIVPEGGFDSFNAFFTRELREGARPVDPRPETLLSPADGRLESAGPLDGGTIHVKGQPYSVAELIGDEGDAAEFEGGGFAVVYLSPRDYHRVHAPATGTVEFARHLPGTLYPVNDIGVEHVPGLFARNERVATFQRSESFGLVCTVMVAAIGVGHIVVTFDDLETNRQARGGTRRYGRVAPELERGEELGLFELGSTAIVFWTAAAGLEVVPSVGDTVCMGEALAIAQAKTP